jgi:hypothetical protein
MTKQVEQALKALQGKEVEDDNIPSAGSASSISNGDPAGESSGGSQFWRDYPWTPMHQSNQESGQATNGSATFSHGSLPLRHPMTYGADLGEENTPSLTYPLTTYESPELPIPTNPATHILSGPTLCLTDAFGGPTLVVMGGPPPAVPDDEWVCPNVRNLLLSRRLLIMLTGSVSGKESSCSYSMLQVRGLQVRCKYR